MQRNKFTQGVIGEKLLVLLCESEISRILHSESLCTFSAQRRLVCSVNLFGTMGPSFVCFCAIKTARKSTPLTPNCFNARWWMTHAVDKSSMWCSAVTSHQTDCGFRFAAMVESLFSQSKAGMSVIIN